ncbi:hypothetical protein chiPu_0030400, partial [Chiloscyllium punctatum]|nr:hypothetical protein [Chiloscyllium punctatum]
MQLCQCLHRYVLCVCVSICTGTCRVCVCQYLQ